MRALGCALQGAGAIGENDSWLAFGRHEIAMKQPFSGLAAPLRPAASASMTEKEQAFLREIWSQRGNQTGRAGRLPL
ncbi:hypothetical protein C5L14_26635 [Labrys okinawensis]|uniref:Uncharacterized protein n=1 Tax=Labrys okinawensis TaxID=346911 RepID=A0A2S9Q508_9HYPH|nr:hypothetical protein C5L14_26635 [Labrys okinawensis]